MTRSNQNAQSSAAIVLAPNLKPRASVIFMHGLGADANDLLDIVPELDLPEQMAVRFVFPNAPMRPVTMADGFAMRAWFDIGHKIDKFEDEVGLRQSIATVEQLIAQEIDLGVDAEHIVLAGFSQGAIMAMQCGLRYPQKLGGMLVLSGALLLGDKLAKEKTVANQQTPILMIHGTHDPVISFAWAQRSFTELKNMDLNIELQTYQIEHSICPEEIQAIAVWLKQVLG
jgi:phospholipase/carboxylesterase